MTLLLSIKNVVRLGYSKGFFHILISSSLVKIIGFLSTMFLPRALGDKDVFGLLVYIDNIFNYLLLFNALGIATATMRFCTQESDTSKQSGIFIALTITGFIIDLIIAGAWILFLFFFTPRFPEAKSLLYLMSGIPIFTFLFEDFQMLFRASLRNKTFSVVSFGYSLLLLLCQVGLGYLYGIKGVISGRYIAIILSIILCCCCLRELSFFKGRVILPSLVELKDMVKFGVVMMLSNSTSYIMQLNEIFLIGYLLADVSLLADYKIASYILSITFFVMQAMMIVIFPYFIKHKEDKGWIWSQFKKIFAINIVVMLPIHLLLIVGAEYFITFAFGTKYISALPIMILLIIASLGQTVFRALPGNIFAGIGEEGYSLKINIFFLVVHLIIDYYAITYFGIYGAAVGLIVVYYTSGFLMIRRLKNVCRHETRI